MKNFNGWLIGMLLGGLGMGGAIGFAVANGVNKSKQNPFGDSSGSSKSMTSGPLFDLNGTAYSAENLPDQIKNNMYEIQNQAYEQISNLAKEYAIRTAIFKEKNPTGDVKTLPTMEELLGASEVTEAELKDFYEKNKASMGGMPFDQIKPRLQQFLAGQKVSQVAREKLAQLESSGKFKLLVTPPEAPHVALNLEGFPTKGGANAAVTVVEVTDFLCSHCRHAKPEVAEIVKEYGDKIKLVQVDFALNPTSLSGALAKGSYCSKQQGGDEAYWKYFDKAFEVPPTAGDVPAGADAPKHYASVAAKAAKEAGLDDVKFEQCILSAEAQKAMEETNDRMSKAGVNATPTFYVNNRKVISGATNGLRTAIQMALGGAKTKN